MLLYEWTREKHNRSFGVTDIGISRTGYVISTELPDQKFFASIVSTMAETTELIKLLADQIQLQRQQMEQQAQQHREEMQTLLKLLDVQKRGTGEDDSSTHHPQLSAAAIPPFAAFDSTSELWPDYWSRFCTFVVANAVPEQCQAQVFLTNQTAAVYKQLANLATQQTPPKDINKLTMSEIVNFMKEQFDPKLFIVRKRFKFRVACNGNQAKLFRSWQRAYVKTRLPVIFLRSKIHKTKLCTRDSYALSTMNLS